MGMAIANPRVWTVEDVWALPDDPRHRYEAVDGELLVSPAPRLSHQIAVGWLQARLDAYARAQAVGLAVCAPSDVVLDARTLVQPDVYVLPFVNGRRAPDDGEKSVPLLVVEVSSPSTARFDRVTKRRRYQRAGIEYWVVDLDAGLVERWAPAADRPEICVQLVDWWPQGAAEALQLDVAGLMAHVSGV